MKNFLCEPLHLGIIIAVLTLSLIITAAGKSVGGLISALFKKIGGKGDVIVNVGKEDVNLIETYRGPERRSSMVCHFDPDRCVANIKVEEAKDAVSTLQGTVSDTRSLVESVSKQINDINNRTSRMEGQLDLLLKGARVRWNAGLIPPEK